MRRADIAFLLTTGCLGCQTAAEPSPLAALGRVDRAQVTVWRLAGGAPLACIVVRDSATLGLLRALATAPGDRAPIGLATAPAGDVRAALFRDTVYVGVLSAGPGWVGVRDAAGTQRFRTMSAAESAQVARLRAGR